MNSIVQCGKLMHRAGMGLRRCGLAGLVKSECGPSKGLLSGSIMGMRSSSNDVKKFMETETMRMYNGSKMPTGLFSEGEVMGRVERLRQYMEENGVAACLFTSIHNIGYFSGGFLYCGFGRPYGLLITPEKHITISSLIDAGQPWRRSIQDNITYTDWKKDNFYRAVVQELGSIKGHLGVEDDHMSLQVSSKLRTHLPHNNTLVDISKPAMRMRMVKSQEEIAVLKNSTATADIGAWACAEALGAGVPEYEVALAGTRAMVRHIAKIYPDSDLMDSQYKQCPPYWTFGNGNPNFLPSSAWAWLQSGINTDGAHNPVTARKIQPGDILSLNCFSLPQGYYTSVERTCFLDHCSDHHLKVWEANVAVHKRGMELIRPGARLSEITRELNELYAQFGLLKYRTFGYGHSFGFLSHYYGREAELELREDIETVLEPGMLVSMEPMVTIPEGQPGAGGYRELSILVINDGSVENITGFPIGPEHNIFKK